MAGEVKSHSPGLQTSVSESVPSYRFLPVSGSLEGEAVSLSVLVPARKVFPNFRRGTVIDAKYRRTQQLYPERVTSHRIC